MELIFLLNPCIHVEHEKTGLKIETIKILTVELIDGTLCGNNIAGECDITVCGLPKCILEIVKFGSPDRRLLVTGYLKSYINMEFTLTVIIRS